MQRLIGGVGQGEAKDSFLRVVWNPGEPVEPVEPVEEDMVSSGGIAALQQQRGRLLLRGSGFLVSQSSREDRGRDIVIFFFLPGLQSEHGILCDRSCRREMQTGGHDM